MQISLSHRCQNAVHVPRGDRMTSTRVHRRNSESQSMLVSHADLRALVAELPPSHESAARILHDLCEAASQRYLAATIGSPHSVAAAACECTCGGLDDGGSADFCLVPLRVSCAASVLGRRRECCITYRPSCLLCRRGFLLLPLELGRCTDGRGVRVLGSRQCCSPFDTAS
jgi:hypothetical protein